MIVYCYRNLNKPGVTWSVKDWKTKRLKYHTFTIMLKDVVLKVSEAGRQRVLRELRKNVHAYVKGEIINKAPEGTLWTKATYNPYRMKKFETIDGDEVEVANYAMLCEDGLFISGGCKCIN